VYKHIEGFFFKPKEIFEAWSMKQVGKAEKRGLFIHIE